MSEEISEKEQKILKEHEDNLENQEVASTDPKTAKKVVAEVIQGGFSGPIPPPSIMEGYERILPGSADRIIAMAEKQSEHRQRMEEIMITAESRDSFLGVLFAFLIGIGCLITAGIMVFIVPKSGAAIAGAVLGVTGIGSITSSFIVNTRRGSAKKERDREKDDAS